MMFRAFILTLVLLGHSALLFILPDSSIDLLNLLTFLLEFRVVRDLSVWLFAMTAFIWLMIPLVNMNILVISLFRLREIDF